MVESKSAEELALEMFRDEVRCTRIIRRMAEKAEACGDDLLAHERSTSANNSRLSVSRLARIIRAIREERLSRCADADLHTSRGEPKE